MSPIAGGKISSSNIQNISDRLNQRMLMLTFPTTTGFNAVNGMAGFNGGIVFKLIYRRIVCVSDNVIWVKVTKMILHIRQPQRVQPESIHNHFILALHVKKSCIDAETKISE